MSHETFQIKRYKYTNKHNCAKNIYEIIDIEDVRPSRYIYGEVYKFTKQQSNFLFQISHCKITLKIVNLTTFG